LRRKEGLKTKEQKEEEKEDWWLKPINSPWGCIREGFFKILNPKINNK